MKVTRKARTVKPSKGAAGVDVREVTAARFAELHGVHHNTVGNWLKAGLPVRRESRVAMIDLAAGIQWVRARDAQAAEAAVEEMRERADPKAVQTRKTAAEARLKELDLAERKGEIVTTSAVAESWAQQTIAVREAVMAVPGIVVQAGLVRPEDERAVGEICRDALVQAATKIVDAASEEAADAPDEPAAEPVPVEALT